LAATVIGPYTAGEIPPPLTVNFKTSALVAIDFSAGGPWTARLTYRLYGGAWVTRTCTAPTLATGAVTYVWVAADFAVPGDVEGAMWVGNAGANRYASIPLSWQIRPAIVPALTI
jgi:hypothetical protein